MLEFLLAAILAALIWLAATASSCEAAQWMTAGIPAWGQALGTAAAVGVAYVVYQDWNKQEIMKAKARQAEELLPKLSALNEAFYRARFPSRYDEPVPLATLAKFVSDERKGVVHDTFNKAVAVSGMLVVLLDDKLKEDVEEILLMTAELRAGYEYLEDCVASFDVNSAQDRADFVNNQLYKDEVPSFLRVMGWRPKKLGRPEHMMDEFGARNDMLYEAVRARARKHILFQNGD
jgi:hypothetical protein